MDSGTGENSRRDRGKAGSEPRDRHTGSHSLKGPEEGGPQREGPEETDTSPQLEKGCGESSGEGSNSRPAWRLEQPKSAMSLKSLTVIYSGHIQDSQVRMEYFLSSGNLQLVTIL